ncbi:MAG TPA: DedA family protein [Myxococcales bacterium]
MEEIVTQILTGSSGAGAYALVLGVLLLCGLGVPLPEDVALITGGLLVYEGAARLDVMILVAFVGILGGDSIAFMLGRHLGDRLTRVWPFRLIVTPAKQAKVEGLFARYGEKIVMAARFMPGVRAVTYFIAGAAGMSYPKFIGFDGLAAMVSAPVFVLLGWHFGGRIHWLIKEVRKGQTTVLAVLAGVAFAVLAIKYLRKRMARRAEAAEAAKRPLDALPVAAPVQPAPVVPPKPTEDAARLAK